MVIAAVWGEFISHDVAHTPQQVIISIFCEYSKSFYYKVRALGWISGSTFEVLQC